MVSMYQIIAHCLRNNHNDYRNILTIFIIFILFSNISDVYDYATIDCLAVGWV